MRKNTTQLGYLSFIILFLIIITACKKLEKLMAVRTVEVTNILANSAEISGEVIDIGEGIIQYGHCYAKTPNVSIAALKTEFGFRTDTGKFTSHLTNLDPGTKYYIKAYISNGYETQYGNEISFSTELISVPSVITDSVSSINATTAKCGGTISGDGGETVTARGVCWDTVSGPTINDNKTIDGSGTGSFTSIITKLIPETTYYIRAYATNSLGTAYGNELSFTTTAISLPSGIVAFYPFDSNANDESGNGNDGTVYGATLTTDRFGNINSAYKFDGVNDYISASPELPINNQARSISGWFKTISASGSNGWYNNTIVSWGSPSTNNLFSVVVYASELLFNAFGVSYSVYTGKIVNDGIWHHTVITYDGSVLKIYLDNIEVASESKNLNTVNSSFYIGRRVGQDTQFMNGSVDDIFIFSSVLTSDEVDLLYKVGK